MRWPPSERAYNLVIEVVTPLSSRKINRSGATVRILAMNSSRRLRLASVSRSVAWSDFFSNADPTSAPDTKPARGSVLLRLRCEAWLAIGPESDRVALQPSQLPASAPQLRPVACVQACAAPARIGPCACAAPKSFWPNPHSQKSGTPNAPENSRLRRRPIETYGANHPHRVSHRFTRRRVSP